MFRERTGKSLVKQAEKKEWIDFQGWENYLISYNKLEGKMMLLKSECSYDQKKKKKSHEKVILNQNKKLLKI